MAVVQPAQEQNKAWLFSISSNPGINRSPGGFQKILFYYLLQELMNSWPYGTADTENFNVFKWLGKNSLKQLPTKTPFPFQKVTKLQNTLDKYYCWLPQETSVSWTDFTYGKYSSCTFSDQNILSLKLHGWETRALFFSMTGYPSIFFHINICFD